MDKPKIYKFNPLKVVNGEMERYRIESANDLGTILTSYYYFHKGAIFTIACGKNESGLPDPVKGETIIHTIISGKVKYFSPSQNFVLTAGDSLTFFELEEDYKVEMLEDTTIFVVNSYTINTNELMDQKLQNFISLINDRDEYTKRHCVSVANLCCEIALKINPKCPSYFLGELGQAGAIHDVGKIDIPDEILLKPSRLTDMEFEIIKTHVDKGVEIIKKAGLSDNIVEIVSQHHERLDGSGYPKHLTSDKICYGAKIMMVVDMFDALTTRRCYRDKLSNTEALDIIQRDVDKGKIDKMIFETLKTCVLNNSVYNHEKDD